MLLRFLKNWTLPIAIVMGAVVYLLYANLSLFDFSRPWAPRAVAVVQPLLIFSMLFLSFCKVDARQLRPRLAHLWLLLIQCGSFAAMAVLLHFLPQLPGRVCVEAAMLCMICPTATAAAVVTQKLHGDGADITMYILLINICVALLVPLLVPLIHPQGDVPFLLSLGRILARVFPLLLCPLLLAQFVRWFTPRLLAWFCSLHDLPFYIWAVALSLAIAVTTRSLLHTDHSAAEVTGIALASFVACVVQFYLGRRIGQRYGTPISSAQSLGQKNTVFAIWLAYTYLSPETSIAGGFYSVWHNVYNTYQLRKASKAEQQI